MPNAGSNHTCLEAITIDFALKKKENYYLEVFLKECKYVKKKWLDILLKIQKFLVMSLMKNKLRWVKFLERKK